MKFIMICSIAESGGNLERSFGYVRFSGCRTDDNPISIGFGSDAYRIFFDAYRIFFDTYRISTPKLFSSYFIFIRFVYNSRFYDTFASDFGVAAMLPHPVSKRESGEKPELYP